jgi:dipeptide transport system substrate-binding protein
MQKFYISVQLFVLALISLNAWATHPHESQQKLVFCSEGSPDHFAPSLRATTTSRNINNAIYETLVTHIRGETKLAPGLAEHWEISPDGKQYTFFLRRGVKWHSNRFFQPKRSFNADDVLFMLERQWKTDHPFHRVTGSDHQYFKIAGLGDLIHAVERIDDYTIKIKLREPTAPFLSILTHPFSGIQNKEYAMAMLKQGRPEIIDQQPIGTGPFQFLHYEKDERVQFTAFLDYWRGRSKLDALDFLIAPQASNRWLKLKNNECHVMPHPNLDDLYEMRRHPEISVIEQTGLNIGYLAYNVKKPPFNNVRVRQALNMAINKQAILERVFQGTAVDAVNLIPPTMWSYNHRVPSDRYDPAAAKQQLKDAGFENGFATDLWVMPVERAYNPNPKLMGEMIQRDLSVIGVKAEIKTYEWSDHYKRITSGEHQMALLGWTGFHSDPDYFFHNLLSCKAAIEGGTNIAKFCDPTYEALIQQARQVANPTQRIPLYEEAQRIFKEQAPWLTISYGKQIVVIRKEVLNFRLNPFGLQQFYGVELMPSNQNSPEQK